MAYLNPKALQCSLEYIRDNCTHIYLMANLVPGDEDDWATFYGKSIGNAVISSNDFSAITEDADGDVSITFIGKPGTATASSTGHNTSIALVNEGGAVGEQVLSITNETTNRAVVDGESFSFPAYSTYANQPTQL